MTPPAAPSRRELLALAWIPFLPPRYVGLAGARFHVIRNGHSRRRYIVIHGNEETARAVLLRHIDRQEGVAFVVEGHTRNVRVDGLLLDPNRMFSRTGAEANLRSLNPEATPDRLRRALDALDHGRPGLVHALTPPRGGLLFALHNNSGGYSVRDEVPISDRVSLREPGNPHAFFLCTDPRDFELLSESPYNVVLQRTAPPADDGSLSRLAAAREFRYVNLEVGLGHFDRQREMVWWLEFHLP